jgi:hypothetical protein
MELDPGHALAFMRARRDALERVIWHQLVAEIPQMEEAWSSVRPKVKDEFRLNVKYAVWAIGEHLAKLAPLPEGQLRDAAASAARNGAQQVVERRLEEMPANLTALSVSSFYLAGQSAGDGNDVLARMIHHAFDSVLTALIAAGRQAS